MDVPVLFLTARSELNERLEGLNLGADDYLTKALYVEELGARIQALGRRASGNARRLLKVEDLTLKESGPVQTAFTLSLPLVRSDENEGRRK